MYRENRWTVLFVIWGILLIVFSIFQLYLMAKILFLSFSFTFGFFISIVFRVLLAAVTFYFGKKLFQENIIYSNNEKFKKYYQKILSESSKKDTGNK